MGVRYDENGRAIVAMNEVRALIAMEVEWMFVVTEEE